MLAVIGVTDRDVHPITAPTFRGDDERGHPQPKVDAYTLWVLEKLVGVRGRDVSDVAYFILRDWIQSHQAELEHLGITIRREDGSLVLQHREGRSTGDSSG